MKNVLMLVLIFINSLWASLAACTASYTTSNTQTAIFDGTINSAPLPCEQGEDCADCMTYILVTKDKTYYLSMTDKMESAMGNEMVYEIGSYTPQATIEGIPFTHGTHQYLKVISYTLKRPAAPLSPLKHLCNRWNVLYTDASSVGPDLADYWTSGYKLLGDTTINGKKYICMQELENI